jgi:uncharacterized protein (DUF488 family)
MRFAKVCVPVGINLVMEAPVLFTVGHSRHTLDELAVLLHSHGVRRLVDVRSMPSSRANPQHAKESLAEAMAAAGILYEWRKVLGGREERDGNLPARLTSNKEVLGCMQQLVATALYGDPVAPADEATGRPAPLPTAMMCSEAHWRECHRQYLAAYCVDRLGVAVNHILPSGSLEAHPTGWCAELLVAMPRSAEAAQEATSGVPATDSAAGAPTKARKAKSRLQ